MDAATISDQTAGALVAGFGAFFLVLVLIGIVLGIFTIWMFIDSLIRSDEDYEKIGTGNKVMWALLIFFLGFIPAVIYWFVVRNKAKKITK